MWCTITYACINKCAIQYLNNRNRLCHLLIPFLQIENHRHFVLPQLAAANIKIHHILIGVKILSKSSPSPTAHSHWLSEGEDRKARGVMAWNRDPIKLRRGWGTLGIRRHKQMHRINMSQLNVLANVLSVIKWKVCQTNSRRTPKRLPKWERNAWKFLFRSRRGCKMECDAH